MKEIIFATTNEAKIRQIQGALMAAEIKVRGVENKDKLPEVVEDGETAIENARKKATVFSKYLDKTVLSMDNALYFEGLDARRQPGVNVRRVEGYTERLSDEQMTEYYSKLVNELGGRVAAYWDFGICVANPDGKTWEISIKSPRIFVSNPSEKVISGYPLESIQIEPESGKYISEMTQEEQNIFWQKAIGKSLLEFIKLVKI